MSNDLSGLPGICTAVRHLVCVVVGAPGPMQAASADPTPSSSTGMMTIKNSESASEYFRSMACLRFEDRCCEATLPVRYSLPAPCRREFRTDFGDAPPFFFPGGRSPSAYQSADGTWLGPCLALGSMSVAAHGRAREDGVTRGAEEELG